MINVKQMRIIQYLLDSSCLDEVKWTIQQLQMTDQESSEWKKRRIIKKGKIYQCGCGKRYKVHATLDEHIKTVHQGKSPGPLKLPEKVSRGRPRQNQYHHFDQVVLDSNPLLHFAERSHQVEDDQDRVKVAYKRQPVYSLIQKFAQGQKKEVEFIEQDKIFHASMGLGLILLQKDIAGLEISQCMKEQITLLLTIYISYVIEETEDQNVLNNGSIGLLPEFVNFFLLYEFQRRCVRLNVQDLWIANSSNATYVFDIIFKWLLFNRYTHTRAIPAPVPILAETNDKNNQ